MNELEDEHQSSSMGKHSTSDSLLCFDDELLAFYFLVLEVISVRIFLALNEEMKKIPACMHTRMTRWERN